jgi:CelD/BcsL family acetyltransferase involved in cellulose biosynthesis
MSPLTELPSATEPQAARPAASAPPERLAVINPLERPDWDALVAANPDCSFFHGSGWARVLHDTYGHQPHYFCRFAGGNLHGLLPVMEVSSPVTGRRGVSLPFSDFCQPLSAGDRGEAGLYELAMEHGRGRGWRYLECRGNDSHWPGASPSLAFYGHVADLDREPAAMFQSLDSSVRRGIRKAEGTTGLRIEFGNQPAAMRTYYALHCRTRQRHGLPPQPFRFFENITRHVLAQGHGFVATARFENQPVAAAVFLQHGRQVLYKFGASDQAFQHLRPNNLMMWEAVKHCATLGFKSLHLGRTSVANEGLRRFKLGFGAREEKLEYRRYDFRQRKFVTDTDRADGWVNHVFRRLPSPALRLAGRLLYPHLS